MYLPPARILFITRIERLLLKWPFFCAFIFTFEQKVILKQNNIGILLSYTLFIVATFFLINHFALFKPISEKDFLNWDAFHYNYIHSISYNFSNVAFFPLFPTIWSYSGLSAIGISIFNFVLFLMAFYALNKELKNCPLETLLFLSLPSFVFMALPYTESLFFLASIFIILGMNREKFDWVLIGLLIASLTRPVFTVFIPAFIISEYLSERTIRQKTLRTLAFIGVSGMGLVLASYIQYLDTDVWFAAFKVQEQWDTYFRFPTFPLRSWAAGIPTRLDGLALFFGMISGIIVFLKMIRFKRLESLKLSQSEVFALSYLAGVSLTVLFFRGGWLPSLNRYLFATAFFMVGFKVFLRFKFTIHWKIIGLSFLILTVYWFLFASYVHIQTLLKFAAVSFIPLGILLFKNKNKKVRLTAFAAIIFVNIIFQLYFYFRHLSGDWVG